MISKAELTKKANISPATITRTKNSMPCRMETQRKIILALGYKISNIRTKCLAMIWSHLSMITEESPLSLNEYQVQLKILPIGSDESTSVIIINDVTEQERAEVMR